VVFGVDLRMLLQWHTENIEKVSRGKHEKGRQSLRTCPSCKRPKKHELSLMSFTRVEHNHT